MKPARAEVVSYLNISIYLLTRDKQEKARKLNKKLLTLFNFLPSSDDLSYSGNLRQGPPINHPESQGVVYLLKLQL